MKVGDRVLVTYDELNEYAIIDSPYGPGNWRVRFDNNINLRGYAEKWLQPAPIPSDEQVVKSTRWLENIEREYDEI